MNSVIEVVGAVIRDEHGRFLCALRSGTMSMSGMWEFPGGKIEPGEHPEASLRREIREELSCDVDVFEMVADTLHEYPSVTVRLRTFFARVTSGVPTPDEHAELRWLHRGELRALRWAPADIPAVDRLVNG